MTTPKKSLLSASAPLLQSIAHSARFPQHLKSSINCQRKSEARHEPCATLKPNCLGDQRVNRKLASLSDYATYRELTLLRGSITRGTRA